MKKSNLMAGIAYVLAGAALIFLAVRWEGRLSSLFWGFGGACLGPGLVMTGQYFYWSAPKNQERYQEKLENEKIRSRDELLEKLRDRSGRLAYLLGLLVASVEIVVIGVLGKLEVVENARLIVLLLGGYWVFQCLSGILIFQYLRKKY